MRGMTTPVLTVMPPPVYLATQILEYCRAVEWGRPMCGEGPATDHARQLTLHECELKKAAIDALKGYIEGTRSFSVPQRSDVTPAAGGFVAPPPAGGPPIPATP